MPARMPRVRLLTRPPLERKFAKRVPSTRPSLCTLHVVRLRTLARPAHEFRWSLWLSLTWLTVGVLALVAAAGCRQRVPPVDAIPSAGGPVQGVVSGTIRGPEGTTPIDGRVLEVINLDTNQRQRVRTNHAGGFSVSLDPGDYRVELTLHEGEAIVRQPGVIHVDRSDVEADADFVIGTGRISRPRPAYRVDDGLGSPVA